MTILCEELLEFGYSSFYSFLWHLEEEGILPKGVGN